jgi:hypothetical protein
MLLRTSEIMRNGMQLRRGRQYQRKDKARERTAN